MPPTGAVFSDVLPMSAGANDYLDWRLPSIPRRACDSWYLDLKTRHPPLCHWYGNRRSLLSWRPRRKDRMSVAERAMVGDWVESVATHKNAIWLRFQCSSSLFIDTRRSAVRGQCCLIGAAKSCENESISFPTLCTFAELGWKTHVTYHSEWNQAPSRGLAGKVGEN